MSTQLPMSILTVIWAIRDARLVRNAESQLALALGMRCNPSNGYTCFPSYNLLALDTGCNVATLKKAAAALERKGLIRRSVRFGKANVFTLCVDKFLEQAEIQRAADKAKWASSGEGAEGANLAAPEGEEVTRHLHLDHQTLTLFRDTGNLELTDEEREYLGYFQFLDEPGTFYGKKIRSSNRWATRIKNAAPEGVCQMCLGTQWACTTSVDEVGNLLTTETDEPCTQCLGTAGEPDQDQPEIANTLTIEKDEPCEEC